MLEQDLKNESQARLAALRDIIREGTASSQEDFCKALKQKKFEVTQSTVSRDLRRIGAVKTIDKNGDVIYMLPEERASFLPPAVSQGLGGLLKTVEANEILIVLHTTPGSASLVARYIDSMRAELGILGTIAGDDTIFVATPAARAQQRLLARLHALFGI